MGGLGLNNRYEPGDSLETGRQLKTSQIVVDWVLLMKWLAPGMRVD